MARTMEDVTTIYRYKVTRSGVHSRDGWGHKAGEPYETISFTGPYVRKTSVSNLWRGKGETLKIELQQLIAAEKDHLWWDTIGTRIEEPEDD